ncbi:MAG: glycosyl hydrolase [Gorillibacterium sp.]|nr:glycosyl hydrolase [Gorillibacterium sp.]
MRSDQMNKKHRRLWPLLILLLLVLAAGGFTFNILWGEQVNKAHEKPDFGPVTRPIFYKGEFIGVGAEGEKAGLMLPLSTYQEYVDKTIRYEQDSESVIITTNDKVVRLKTSQLTGFVNEKPFKMQFPVKKVGGVIYLPVEPLKEFYHLVVLEYPNTGAVVLRKEGDALQWAKVPQNPKHSDQTMALRAKPTLQAPIHSDLKQDTAVTLWGEAEGWYRVLTEDGIPGYMRKSDLVLDRTETVPIQPLKEPFIAWEAMGQKINLTWQQVWSKAADFSSIGDMPGLNVISPQWLHLEDGAGTVVNKVDPAFIAWANKRGYRVWPLFNNGFDPERTTQALSTYDTRMKIIKQLLSYVELYKLNGVNVDFENVYLKDKENFAQFLREMTPLLHEQGAVVSVDITVKAGSDTYSRFLDREALGQTVDYLILMGYDEHWATSPEAGSVASLPWVENGISRILEEDGVPASKMILGVPFYTRIWTEKTEDGETKVSSKAVSMSHIENLLIEKKLTPIMDVASGQHYVEYNEDGSAKKIWIEDEISMTKRMDLVRKYDLAGVASWSRGMETDNIWTRIQDELKKLR